MASSDVPERYVDHVEEKIETPDMRAYTSPRKITTTITTEVTTTTVTEQSLETEVTAVKTSEEDVDIIEQIDSVLHQNLDQSNHDVDSEYLNIENVNEENKELEIVDVSREEQNERYVDRVETYIAVEDVGDIVNIEIVTPSPKSVEGESFKITAEDIAAAKECADQLGSAESSIEMKAVQGDDGRYSIVEVPRSESGMDREDLELFITESERVVDKTDEEHGEIEDRSTTMGMEGSAEQEISIKEQTNELFQATGEIVQATLAEEKEIPPVQVIEVERKFTMTALSEENLKTLNAELISDVEFVDVYYDVGSYKLTLSDYWLRKRNGIWQFKVPARNMVFGTSSTQYQELSTESEIVSKLQSALNFDRSFSTVDDLATHLDIKPFAEFKTERRSYVLDNCRIDLDMTDFGFQIGEIEVLVVDDSRIPDAVKQIDNLAEQLEFQPFQTLRIDI